MSGQQFVQTLKQIGYPNADSLSPRAFDWMFEDEVVLPFLSWFCNTVGHQNVLSLEEKEAFGELESKGEGVLEGTQLDEALACLSSVPSENLSVGALKEDIVRLKEDVERHKKRKQRLVQARNRLSLHHTGLTHRLSRLCDKEDEAKHQYKAAMDSCKMVSSEHATSLDNLVVSTRRLLALYQDSLPTKNGDSKEKKPPEVFLSQVSLNHFYAQEEKYTKELTAFTKKQFFDGIAEIAGGELSRYELLETSDPLSLLVRGNTTREFKEDCQELARIQAVFPKSEAGRINAYVEEKCAAAVLETAEEILQSIRTGFFPKDTMAIGRRLEETNVSLTSARSDLQRVTSKVLPPLIQEAATMQGTTVINGDYRLKLARQDYFTTNQDQVIKFLLEQRARNEFLTMAYEVEARSHREINRLVTAIEQTLHSRLTSSEERMKVMADPNITKARYERGTVDTRDSASARLHHVLVEKQSQAKQLFLSYADMVAAADALKQRHSAAKLEAVSICDQHQDKVEQLEKEVQRCEGVLYTASSTVGGQPLLTPLALHEAMTELGDMLQKLEAAILDIVHDVNSKKKDLRKDALQVKERELFTYFHLHPERLQTTIHEMEERLEAHSVS